MILRRHPGDDRLVAWLDGDEAAAELDDHVGECERCAVRIETIAHDPSPVADALRAVTDPPADLDERIDDRLERVAQGRAAIALAADLLGLGWQTARVVTDPGGTP